MSELNHYIGSRIRLYRQMKRYTLSELAAMIHKSKATLSKYETGEITLDIQTLFDLAGALGIRVQQLIDFAPSEQRQRPSSDNFFPQRQIYVYFYDGRRKKIVRSLLTISHEGVGSVATLYNDLSSFSQPESCLNLYFGTVEFFDTVTNFSFESQSNSIERLTLCAANPFDRSGQVLGMLSGMSRYPMLPVSIKCILSAAPMEEDEHLKALLVLSSKDLKLIRSLNMFAVEQLG